MTKALRADPTVRAETVHGNVFATVPKPGGTEPDIPQTIANRMKGQLLVLCELAYLSSFSSLFLVATNPCVCDTPEASLDT